MIIKVCIAYSLCYSRNSKYLTNILKEVDTTYYYFKLESRIFGLFDQIAVLDSNSKVFSINGFDRSTDKPLTNDSKTSSAIIVLRNSI